TRPSVKYIHSPNASRGSTSHSTVPRRASRTRAGGAASQMLPINRLTCCFMTMSSTLLRIPQAVAPPADELNQAHCHADQRHQKEAGQAKGARQAITPIEQTGQANGIAGQLQQQTEPVQRTGVP